MNEALCFDDMHARPKAQQRLGFNAPPPLPCLTPLCQVHEALCFDMHAQPEAQQMQQRGNFGIFSLKWSGDGREIIAGTNDEVRDGHGDGRERG